MIILLANNTGREAQRLRATFPERIGHIYAPNGWRKPWPRYALENGAYPAWTKGRAVNFDALLALWRRAALAPRRPSWGLVPDVVANRDATLERWYEWAPLLRGFGWPLAFVVQDGMTPSDIPGEAAVIFVGGTTEWKRATVASWCAAHARVHVGRVNGERDLWRYHRAGAESCDGTGWFRGDRKQLDGLWYYLADTEHLADAAHGPMQPRLFSTRYGAGAVGV